MYFYVKHFKIYSIIISHWTFIEQLNQKRNKESYEIRLKSSDNELNEMLKDILKNNIKNTCDLRNRVKTLELQLSNSKITIQSLK